MSFLEDLPYTFSYIIENKDYIEVLGWFFLWFQIFKFIIKKKIRVKYKKEISQLLSFTKNHLLKFKGGISISAFNELEAKLKSFDAVKTSTNPKEIFLYSINVLILTELWDTGHIMKQLKFFFPTIRDLFKK